MFGASRKKTFNHIDSLIIANKIEDRSSIKYELINSKVEGWPYKLYITETESVSTLFDVFSYNDSLYQIAILPYGAMNRKIITAFLKSQYGTPIYAEKDTSTSYSNDSTYHWLKNSYEVVYKETAFGTISFFDLRLKKQVFDQERFIDSLKADIKKNAAKDPKKDFR